MILFSGHLLWNSPFFQPSVEILPLPSGTWWKTTSAKLLDLLVELVGCLEKVDPKTFGPKWWWFNGDFHPIKIPARKKIKKDHLKQIQENDALEHLL